MGQKRSKHDRFPSPSSGKSRANPCGELNHFLEKNMVPVATVALIYSEFIILGPHGREGFQHP